MFAIPSATVYGGSNYNAATGAESRDLRPLSVDDPRYSQRLPQNMLRPGLMSGMPMPNPDKVLTPYGKEPVIMDADGSYGPAPETVGQTPPAFQSGDSVAFSSRPYRLKESPQQGPGIMYAGGSRDFDETTGTLRSEDGRGPIGFPPDRQMGRPMRGGFGQQMQQMNPFMGGFGQQMNPFMGGGGFNPFMGGMGGMGGGGFNPYQQMNPFMGGGGFNPFMGGMGGSGFNPYQQMNPFMGGMGYGGFGGFNPYQQMNPFMGGGFGGYNQQPQAMPYNQQVSQPANPFRNFGGF